MVKLYKASIDIRLYIYFICIGRDDPCYGRVVGTYVGTGGCEVQVRVNQFLELHTMNDLIVNEMKK